MGYSADSSKVRVDVFKVDEDGKPYKWHLTEAMRWVDYSEGLIHDAFKESLRRHFNGRCQGMMAVCLEPYHVHAHPIVSLIP